MRIQFSEPRLLYMIVERIRAMFDLNADPAEIARWLRGDPLLSRIRHGVRVAGCWDGFEMAVTSILTQQAGVRGARLLAGRITEAFGRPFAMAAGLTRLFPVPEVLAGADLRGLGIAAPQLAALAALARSVAAGRLILGAGAAAESVLASLCALPGVERATAEWVAMRALREPDAFPSGDPVLLSAAQMDDSSQLSRRAERWRPWRAYAAACLWTSAMESTALAPSRTNRPMRRGRGTVDRRSVAFGDSAQAVVSHEVVQAARSSALRASATP